MSSEYSIHKLINTIKNYDWGKINGLQEYFNIVETNNQNLHNIPQAELWMGGHPRGISQTIIDNQKVNITELLSEELPFLFKILIIKKPLSIQTHPNQKQAEEGFLREEKTIPLDFNTRCYHDVNEKKEMILAYTPMLVLAGFRKSEEIKINLVPFMNCGFPEKVLDFLEEGNIKKFFNYLLEIDKDKKKDILKNVLVLCKEKDKSLSPSRKGDLYQTILMIHEYHDGDFHCLSPLWLNLISLKKQETLYLPAGQVHSYLSGVGIEVMTNSDNVLRAGLTTKHINIQELLKTVDFNPHFPLRVKGRQVDKIKKIFSHDDFPFVLSFLDLEKENESYDLTLSESPAIFFCSEGEVLITEKNSDEKKLSLKKGESALVFSPKATFSKSEIHQKTNLLIKGRGKVYFI